MTREGTLAALAEGCVDVNRTRRWYESAGAGATVVLLHEHLIDSGQWDGQFSEFARSFHVVRYDARAAGDLDRAVELGLQVWRDGPRRRPDQVSAAARGADAG